MSENGIYPAEKPSNFISLTINETENFKVKISLIAVNLSKDEVDKMQKLNKECEELNTEIAMLQKRKAEIKRKIKNTFQDFCFQVDKQALPYNEK